MLPFLLFLLVPLSQASVLLKEVVSKDGVLLAREASYSRTKVPTEEGGVVLRDLPLYMGEQDFVSKERYREVLLPDSLSTNLKIAATRESTVSIPGAELRTIVKQGPDQNRIVLTILGDGYTEGEKEKFFQDVQLLMDDLFVGVTFKSFTPFFNIYAVFVPSKDSGITDVVKKNTAFGLYRAPVNSKRGIMPGDRMALERALKLAPADAHYPIVIANDDFYGGLGGRYAITTRSRTSGAVVLRHELGHNFSNVGEEYDGGQVYSGANFSPRPSGSWDHWKVGDVKEKHEANKLFGDYAWAKLTSPYTQKFKTTESESLFSVQISSVGWDKEGEVEILLDGHPLELDGIYTIDRSFFATKPFQLKNGDHTLTVRSNGNRADHVLAFALGYTYPVDYDFDSGEVKAFNVFSESGSMVGYRPTEHMCLMRDMLSKVFCPVDQENIWLQFLQRVSLIDMVKFENAQAEVVTMPFADQDLDIRWFKGQMELEEYHNQKIIPTASASGLKVKVKLVSKEVRKASPHFEDEKSL